MAKTHASTRVQQIVRRIQERTAQEAYEIDLLPEQKPALTDSKFGGLPYWDLRQPYPVSLDGEKMILLAQFHFDREKMTPALPLPLTGMLQFFIAKHDEMLGEGMFCENFQRNFRVVYHPAVDPSVTAEQVRAAGIPDIPRQDAAFHGPVFRELGVELRQKTVWMSPDDDRFDAVFAEAAETLCGAEQADWFLFLTEPETEYLRETLSARGHRLLGYPRFDDEDPRQWETGAAYDTLLFQMDSVFAPGGEVWVNWQNRGVGNFFLSHENLLKRDFQQVMYHWNYHPECFYHPEQF